MEAVLLRRRTTAAVSQAQIQTGSPPRGLEVMAFLAERSASSPPQSTSPGRKLSRQSSSLASPQPSSSSSKPGICGPLKQLWNFNNIDEPHRVAEEPLPEIYTGGFVNYETTDGSFIDNSEDDLVCVQSEHTPETFLKFLRQVPATALKAVVQACYLSNLAYISLEDKADDLQQRKHLRIITSSVTHAADMEMSPVSNKEAKGGEMVIHPANAYALAATASYLHSQRNTSTSGGEVFMSSELLARAIDHQLSSAVSSFMGSVGPRRMNAVEVDYNHGEKYFTLTSPSPCQWFVCDELETFTRIFAIQGSESMESWKANLQFQPTEFEDSSSGVMVHQGVYEVAKLLYDQMLPLVQLHVKENRNHARIGFTGHSLGGSLAVLLSLMFRYRGTVPVSALTPVYTFGAPFVMNGGDYLLDHLGFPPNHIQSVVIAHDLVPRIFSCDVPEQIVKVLQRVSQNFRTLPSFVEQGQLYSTYGQMLILQPEAQQAPGHPLLPSGSGLYFLESASKPDHELQSTSSSSKTKEVQEAERSFMNTPHPLEIMSDASSYGSEGGICRYHDPRSYRKALNHILKQALHGLQRRRSRSSIGSPCVDQ